MLTDRMNRFLYPTFSSPCTCIAHPFSLVPSQRQLLLMPGGNQKPVGAWLMCLCPSQTPWSVPLCCLLLLWLPGTRCVRCFLALTCR